MSLSVIRASFECDGCGKPFQVDVDPAKRAWLRRQDVMSIVEDVLRHGSTSDGFFCSVQADMHLCSICTAIADGIKPDDEGYAPTADEIREALA